MDSIDFSLLKKPVVLAGALIVGILVFVLLIAKKPAAASTSDTTPANPGQRDLSGLPPEVFIVTAPPGGVNTAPPTPPSPAPTPGPPAKLPPPSGKDANTGGFLGIRPIIRKTPTGTSTPPAKKALPPVVRKQPGPTPGVARAHEIDLSRNSAPASPASGSQVHVTVAPTVRIPVGVARHFNLDTEE